MRGVTSPLRGSASEPSQRCRELMDSVASRGHDNSRVAAFESGISVVHRSSHRFAIERGPKAAHKQRGAAMQHCWKPASVRDMSVSEGSGMQIFVARNKVSVGGTEHTQQAQQTSSRTGAAAKQEQRNSIDKELWHQPCLKATPNAPSATAWAYRS